MASAAEAAGAKIVTGHTVSRVIVEHGVARGVELSDGSRLEADVVVSNADPQRTYLKLVDEHDLPRGMLRKARQIDMRGTMARVHLLVDRLPQYTGLPAGEGPQHRGFALLGGTTDEYERCWEAQQCGELVDDYPIEMIIQSTTDSTLTSPGLHTITTGIQQLPFSLAHGDWDSRREEFTDRVVRSLARFDPGIESSIRDSSTLTPLDLEREYGLTGGNIFQGAMMVNQLFAARPMAGGGGYRSPIEGLYLCGAGTHPGGGVMGAAGHNAAKAILRDLAGESVAGPIRASARRIDAADALGTSPQLRGVRNWALRQKWLRPLVRRMAKR
jgi:phytoene dehydrogenase-like protein